MEQNDKNNNNSQTASESKSSIIKVIGIGGGAINAVNYMYSQNIEVNFAVLDSDLQHQQAKRENRLHPHPPCPIVPCRNSHLLVVHHRVARHPHHSQRPLRRHRHPRPHPPVNMTREQHNFLSFLSRQSSS